MQQQIYRKEALDRLGSPEQLDQLMPVTSLRGWIALAGLALVLLLALGWGIFGRIVVTAEGAGALTRPGGLTEVRTPAAGVIGDLKVEVTQSVKAGQVITVLKAREIGFGEESESQVEILAPASGRVLEITAGAGEEVAEGQSIVVIEDQTRPLEATIYVSSQDSARIEPGMAARILPQQNRTRDAVYLLGKIRSAAPFPAKRTSVQRVLRNDEWTDSVLRHGPVVECIVEFASDKGFPDLFSGTPCQAVITIEEQRPISLAIPLPRSSEGS